MVLHLTSRVRKNSQLLKSIIYSQQLGGHSYTSAFVSSRACGRRLGGGGGAGSIAVLAPGPDARRHRFSDLPCDTSGRSEGRARRTSDRRGYLALVGEGAAMSEITGIRRPRLAHNTPPSWSHGHVRHEHGARAATRGYLQHLRFVGTRREGQVRHKQRGCEH